MTTDPYGRGTWKYRKACAALRALHYPCAICGRPIDYTAKPMTRWSFTLDHIAPLHQGGSLLDPHNHRAAHFGCNSRRGTIQRNNARGYGRYANQTPPGPSRAW